jgi:DNA-binding CsgD family transcriptional regulator
MNRQEREDYVIQLYKEGRTVKDIARIVHMSFRDIGAITNKVKLQAERERGYTNEDIQPKSPESRAFKMFSEGKSPVEVAILLDLAADRVRAIYQDYWELTGRHELAQLYDEARYDLRVSLRGTNPGSKMIALLSLQI